MESIEKDVVVFDFHTSLEVNKFSVQLKNDLNRDAISEKCKNLFYLADKYQMAKKRSGNAHTKTRAEVSGGGRKPYKQKGTGHARRGSTRSPLIRGGGVIFGPSKRSFSISLNKKVLKLAYAYGYTFSLNSMKGISFQDDNEFLKTKAAFSFFQKIGENLNKKETLLLLDKDDSTLMRAVKNLSFLKTLRVDECPISDLISFESIWVTERSFSFLSRRCYGVN